jgi:O-antigen/teichoic acid export membrane protein
VTEAPAVRRPLAAGATASLVAQVLPLGAAAAVSIVVGRLLGPSANGQLSLANSLFDVALLLFGLGVPAGITYLVSRRSWGVREALRESHRFALATGLLGTAVALLTYALLRPTVFDGVEWALAAVVVGSLPFALAWSFSSAIALGRDRYEAYAALQVAHALVILGLSVGLAFPFGVLGAGIGFAAANIVAAVGGVWWAAGHARATPAVSEGGQLGSATRFGVRAWGADLLQLVNYRLDIFLVGALATRSDVGVYSIALSVTALAWVLPSALQNVLFPRTADLHAASEAGEVTVAESDALVQRALRHGVLLVLPTAAIVAVLLVGGVPLVYGSRFDRTVTLGLILVPGVVLLGVGKIASAVISGRGFPQYSLYTGFVDLPVTVVLYVVLISAYGVTGAAIASSISYALTTALALFFVHRATGLPVGRSLLPTRGDLDDYRHALAGLAARARLILRSRRMAPEAASPGPHRPPRPPARGG